MQRCTNAKHTVAHYSGLINTTKSELIVADADLARAQGNLNNVRERIHSLEAKVVASKEARKTMDAGRALYTKRCMRLPQWAVVYGEKTAVFEQDETAALDRFTRVLKDAETMHNRADEHARELSMRMCTLSAQKEEQDALYRVRRSEAIAAKTRQESFKPVYIAAKDFEQKEASASYNEV